MAISNAVSLANFSSGDALTVDSINDRVGIASTVPTEALTVVGVVSATSFSGSGANLTDVISGVETKEGGTSKGTSQTSLNFVGATVAASGAESTITVTSIPTQITVTDESSDTTCFPLFATAATGDLGPKSGTNLTFNSSTGALTATSFSGGAGAFSGNVTLQANLDMQDDDQIQLGTGDDLKLYHSSNNNSYIENHTGSLFIDQNVDDNDINIRCDNSSGGTTTYIQADGSTGKVKLYHYGTQKFETKSDGVDITGELQCDSLDVDGNSVLTGDVDFIGDNYNAVWDKSANRLKFNDNAEAVFGTGADLKIYHDGSDSKIVNTTGDFFIEGVDNKFLYIRAKTGENSIICKDDGAVELYHDNSKKFETSATGVTVTGDLNSTSDINLKKDIEVVSSATEMVNQLRGVKFTWKENDEKSVGVIAQEVENILPELVKGEEGEKSVNYSGLVGVLIEAVKELTEEVNTLKSQLNK